MDEDRLFAVALLQVEIELSQKISRVLFFLLHGVVEAAYVSLGASV
jgi:hypothetical protein